MGFEAKAFKLFSYCNGKQPPNLSEVDDLLKHFANIDIDSFVTCKFLFFKWTSLHAACNNGYYDVVHLILQYSTIACCQLNRFEEMPLFLAAKNGHTKIVKRLLETGCKTFDHRNATGKTALSIASQHGHRENQIENPTSTLTNTITPLN